MNKEHYHSHFGFPHALPNVDVQCDAESFSSFLRFSSSPSITIFTTGWHGVPRWLQQQHGK